MIRTVIFDLGNVIIPFDFGKAYALMTERTGLEKEEIRARIASTTLVRDFESGKISTPDFVHRLTSLLGHPMSDADFEPIWGSIFERETLVSDSLPETLRANGYRLLVLSNTNDLHMRFVRKRYPILRHFHHLVLSHEVGAQKPSDQIYDAAIANAGCAPRECFFTDDIAAYVEGARGKGINAVQFQNEQQLRDALTAHGVRI